MSDGSARTPMSPLRAWLLAGTAVGVLDLLDAIVFYGLRGVRPMRIPQSIAAGLMGRAAFAGGAATAALGLVLHFFIAFSIAGVFLAAARRVPRLLRPWWAWGTLYGVAVYGVMYYVVIPLSAATPPHFRLPVFADEILIHIFGVGWPCAWLATRTEAPAPRPEPAAAE